MIEARFEDGRFFVQKYGLTQWDYGQELRIYGLSGEKITEVHFCNEGDKEAEIRTVQRLEDGSVSVSIPNKLLETGRDIRAYLYKTNVEEGETLREIFLMVHRREKPGDFSSHDDKNLLRQIMEKVDGKADNLQLIGRELQLLSGDNAIGSKIRLPVGSGTGIEREIEIKNNGEAIVWRYTDSNEWIELIKLSDMKGKDGITPEFEIRNGYLYAIYKEV